MRVTTRFGSQVDGMEWRGLSYITWGAKRSYLYQAPYLQDVQETKYERMTRIKGPAE